MTPKELDAIFDARRPKVIGGMHEDDYFRGLERMAELEEQGYKVI